MGPTVVYSRALCQIEPDVPAVLLSLCRPSGADASLNAGKDD